MTTQAATAVPVARARSLAASAWLVAVCVGAAVYSVALSAESIADHHMFRTNFDTALYDQLLWLLAHGEDPFSTVVSRPMLGDHFQPGLVLFTPLYWLGLGVPGMLAAQSVALALTAPALYALGRHCGASAGVAAIPAFLWLVCPWVASANLFEFRPPALAPVLLVLSVLAALKRRDGLLAATTIVALSLKEDVALTYVVLGLLVALRGRRRAGAVLAAASAAWFVVASWAVESLGGSYDLFGQRFAGDRGDSVRDALVWAARHPLETISDVASQSLPDLFLIFLSSAGLPLLAPTWALLALPTAAHNALSAYTPQHDLAFHYHLGTVAGVFVAAAIGSARVGGLGRTGRLGAVVLLSLAGVVAFVGGARMHAQAGTALRLDAAASHRALARIPADVPAAATLSLLPHLSQRKEIYTLPEPFVPIAWGGTLTPGELARRAERVRWAAYIRGDQVRRVTTRTNPDVFPDVRETLRRRGFVVVERAGPLEILHRP